MRKCDEQKLIELEERVSSLRRSQKIRAVADLDNPNQKVMMDLKGMYEAKIANLESHIRSLNSTLTAERRSKATSASSDKTDREGNWSDNFFSSSSSSSLFGSNSKSSNEKELGMNKEKGATPRYEQASSDSSESLQRQTWGQA